jgi:hypothetical protein
MDKKFFAAEILKLLDCYAGEHCERCSEDREVEDRLDIIKSYPREADLDYILELIADSPCFDYIESLGSFLEQLYSEEKKIELYENLFSLYHEIETLKELIREEEWIRNSKRLDRL